MDGSNHPITLAPAHAGMLLIPEPRQPISIRKATMDDYAFIDALQKKHSKMVGFLHRSAVEAYINSGDVLVAEEISDQKSDVSQAESTLASDLRPLPSGRPLGYIIGRDKYFKREDVGIIYQLVVSQGSQRGLIGAALVQHMFENAAYGCKLFCCWCAQDLPANHFWEACGFVPIAFRTGSINRGKGGAERMHIFWQKRIRKGDDGPAAGGTPWWFPSTTNAGALRADRLVLPIPPGTHWSDAKPTILPDIPGVDRLIACEEKEVSDGDCDSDSDSPARRRRTKKAGKNNATNAAPKKKKKKEPASIVASGGFHFGTAAVERAQAEAEAKAEQEAERTRSAARKKKRAKKEPKKVYHPEYIAAARELCARYLDEVRHRPELVDESTAGGKYDVSRVLEHAPSSFNAARRLAAGSRRADDDADTNDNLKLLDAA